MQLPQVIIRYCTHMLIYPMCQSFELTSFVCIIKLDQQGCGYENGEELLSIYTMAQTSFSLFFSVVTLMAMCMAWKVDQGDIDDRQVNRISTILSYISRTLILILVKIYYRLPRNG
jgi:hypothetical protein